jgi:hypothetical protein
MLKSVNEGPAPRAAASRHARGISSLATIPAVAATRPVAGELEAMTNDYPSEGGRRP